MAVAITQPERRAVSDTFLEREATLYSISQPVISTRQEGFAKRRHVEVGDFVRAGDVLVELDPRDHELTLRERRAALRRAQTLYQEKEREARRGRELHQGRIISADDLEDRQGALERAHADVEEAQTRVERAERALEELRIVAPMDAVVSESLAEAGEYLTRGDPLLELMQVDTLMAVCTVSEQFIGEIREGAPVRVTVSAYPERRFEGMIWKIMPAALLESRSFPIKVLVPNPDFSLKPGMSARVSFVQRIENALLIPRDAVERRGDDTFVWVVADGVVEERAVELGLFFDQNVHVRRGLTTRDSVVVTGNEMLAPGAEVHVAELPPPGPPTLPPVLEAGSDSAPES